MYEKISEEELRLEKVRKVKNKILSELYERLYAYKRRVQQNTEISDEDFDYCIRKIFALLELKKYLLNDNCFMGYEAKYGNEDIVIYMVSEKDLNVWAQKNYNFIFNFLHRVEENEYNVSQLLNDRFFGYDFTDAFDHILYDENYEDEREEE